MNTIEDVAQVLRREAQAQSQSYTDLRTKTGLAYLSVRSALRGETDCQLSTLLALTHALGLELALVPRQDNRQHIHTTPTFTKHALNETTECIMKSPASDTDSGK
jgi:cyanate lyase